MARTKKRTSGTITKSNVREYFESIVIAVILALFIRTFVVQAFKIPTGSMEENLLIGDHLLVNKFVLGPSLTAVERRLLPIAPPERGEIVVFKFPEEPERDFIKRVIGLPGETIELHERRVFVDGEPLDEPYAHYLLPPGSGDLDEVTSLDVRERYGPVTVPRDHYFVMGDNRDNSQDSRYWGFLPRELIKGRAAIIYWSFDSGPEFASSESGGTLGNLASVFIHFFTRTRWERTLQQIR